MGKWLMGFLLAGQILFVVVALYGYGQMHRVVTQSVGMPTPSCPGEVKTYWSREQVYRCVRERLDLYLPKWIFPVTWISAVGSILCVVASIVVWRRLWRMRPAAKWIIVSQLGIMLLFFCVLMTLMPGVVLPIIA